MDERTVDIDVALLVVGVNETRLDVDDREIADLAVSIGRIGLINPLVVAERDGKYVVVAGHRRFAAVLKCGLTKVQCHVVRTNQTVAKEIAVAENLFRVDLSPVEPGCMMRDIIENGAMDSPTLAKAMHRSEHWVQSRLDLLNWPDDVLASLHVSKLSVAAASNLALVTDDTYRGFLLRNATEAGATARTTAAWLQAWRASVPPDQAIETEPVAVGAASAAAVPQAPCICCGEIKRTDALATVLICPGCVAAIRNASR